MLPSRSTFHSLRHCCPVALIVGFALFIVSHLAAQFPSDGTVKSFQKISATEGGFSATLDNSDFFGISTAALGDLDGDGVLDLAVGAAYDDDGGSGRGAVYVLFMNADGSVKSYQKISATAGSFTATLDNSDYFGLSMAALGDLDGDGVTDLAVGAGYDDDGGSDRGAVYVLFMNTNGSVKSFQKISDTQGGFTATLANGNAFGSALGALGDLDGDGIGDLAVGAFLDDTGGQDRGALYFLFLNANGTVKSYQKVSDTEGGFTATLDNFDYFGRSLAALGDLDGDGVTDLAVGADADDDGGIERGAVYVLFMNANGTVKSYQKISATEGNFTATLDNDDRLGMSVAALGDLDADGVTDLVAAAYADDDGGSGRGAVYVLFLNANGTVKSFQKISDTAGGFTATLEDTDSFGISTASLGDLDGDSVTDLAVGAHYDDDGGTNRGAVYVLFLHEAGLLASYPFDGNANDASGNGNHGTVNGATPAPDRFDNTDAAYEFPGSSSISIPTPASILNTPIDQFTFQAWIKSTSGNGTQNVYEVSTSATAVNNEVYFEADMPAPMRFGVTNNSGGEYQASSQSLDLNTWYQIVGTYDGSAQKLYVNGELHDSLAWADNFTITSGALIGRDIQGGQDFNGLIDDIRIYDRALSKAEIQALYHEGGWDPDLIAYYPFNGNANDESGNGHPGTVYGVTLTNDRFGNANSAFSFDGVDDFIWMGDNVDWDFASGDFALGFWMSLADLDNTHDGLFGRDDYQWIALEYNHSDSRKLSLWIDADGASPWELELVEAGLKDDWVADEWHHVVVTRLGDSVKVYVDCQVDMRAQYTSSVYNPTGTPLYFGRSQLVGRQHHGNLDDIRIYGRALSEAEIQALYHEGGWGAELPAIVSTSPARNALNVAQNAAISVTFDMDMDPASLDAATFVVHAGQTGKVGGTYSYDSGTYTATFTPDNSFKVGEPVSVTLTTGVQSAAGEALTDPHSWSFTVEVPEGAGEFAAQATYGTWSHPWSVTAADFDGDTNLDLAVANIGSGNISVLLGNGDGTFATHVAYPTASSPYAVAAADLDGDGDLDLAAACYSDSVSILLGNGEGTFTTRTSYAAGSDARAVGIADLDGDGNADLAVANESSSDISILLGNGEGTFTDQTTYTAAGNPWSVAAADLDLDWDIDLVVANETTDNISVFLGNGDGTFAAQTAYSTGDSPRSVAIVDLDGDSAPDLAVTNEYSNNISVLLGNGDGTFAAQTTYAAGTYPGSVVAADLDGDGDADLAAANNYSDDVSVLLGNGDGTFAAQTTHAAGGYPSSVLAADLDSDGDLDLVTANYNSDNVSVLLNTSGAPPVIGLIAWYPFNGNANDESGNGNYVTVDGAMLAEDRFGNASSAYSFDGENDVIAGSLIQFSMSDTALTTAAWFYQPGAEGHPGRGIVGVGEGSNRRHFYQRLSTVQGDAIWDGSDGQNRFWISADDGGADRWWGSDTFITTGEWHLGVTTYIASSREVRIYIDGVPDRTITLSAELTLANDLFIGGDGYNDNYFAGRIDDIRIYNRALSIAEIQALYQEGDWDPDLVAYYPFNGDAEDESGNAHDGTIHGAALTEDRFGNANSAYSFDGVDDYINVAASDALKITDEITVTAWISFTGGGQNPRIVSFGPLPRNGYELMTETSQAARPVRFEFGGRIVISKKQLPENTLFFVAATADAVESQLYINSILDTTQTGTTGDFDYSTPFLIGQTGTSSLDAWGGTIDDIRIYRRALSAEEIQELYLEGGWVGEDVRGPAISDVDAPESIARRTPVTVTATLRDPHGVQSADLFYLTGGTDRFSQVPMTDQGSNNWSGTIPGTAVAATGLAYFIAASDSLGNTARSRKASIPVTFPAGIMSTSITGSAFPDGFPVNKWRLISIPGAIDETSVDGIIQDALETASSDETWGMFRYTGPGADDYVTVAEFASGESYFLKQIVADDVHFTLGGGQSLDLTGYTWTLQPRRWHFISSPYPFTVTVSADQDTFIGPYAYGEFGPGGQEGWSTEQVQTDFQAWGGYILYNNTDETRTLATTPPGMAKRMLLAKDADPPPPGWLLHLTAEGERFFDGGNTVGRLAGALEDRDDYDLPEPPILTECISLTMQRSDWTAGTTFFTTDIRSLEELNGVWDLDLHTRGETGPVVITCRIQGEVPQGIQVALLDVVRRRACDLTAGEQPEAITGYNEQLPYRLKVVAGSAGFVQATIAEILARLPDEFALAQNYPNPFNPSTTISYALPLPAKVSLRIYNLLGQEVAVLHNDWQDTGYYEILWHGRDQAGRNVASGMYFAILRADRQILARKMVLIR
ncbi:MAG: VCBS repeat-containing protein [Fidelibacterota bacterium]|nr:MAG: VCBS repeat-containing protein [Candidatus Neomarinimicrobiota bacterium]